MEEIVARAKAMGKGGAEGGMGRGEGGQKEEESVRPFPCAQFGGF